MSQNLKFNLNLRSFFSVEVSSYDSNVDCGRELVLLLLIRIMHVYLKNVNQHNTKKFY